ncbi:uncharacterized protein LOC132593204 isoform X3 [Zootoca vivipara]|uniref:uncharacterized protein LOC132593204 isoform X3 n=1 Tax=Zootoca vivipara TaxID=8524 RepID=UPI00293B8A7A|nr:uncharacterized protein LOC132593204 isoform X3 [Zootoca vivipara]
MNLSRARHIPSAALRMANGRTGFWGPRRPCLLLSVFLACFLWHGGVVAEKKKLQCACIAESAKDFKPRCFTDHYSEVGCSWEVDASTDCPKKFFVRVIRTDRISGRTKSLECSPKNKRGQNATPKCTCALQTNEVYSFMYLFSVEAKGKGIWKKSVDPDDIGKGSFGLADSPCALLGAALKNKTRGAAYKWGGKGGFVFMISTNQCSETFLSPSCIHLSTLCKVTTLKGGRFIVAETFVMESPLLQVPGEGYKTSQSRLA